MGFLDDLFTNSDPDWQLAQLKLQQERDANTRLLSAQRAAPRLLADDQMRALPAPQYQSVPQFDPNSGAMSPGGPASDAAPRLGMDDATRARYTTDAMGGPLAQFQAMQNRNIAMNTPTKYGPGEVSMTPAGKILGAAPFAPKEGNKLGATREFQRGDQKVTQQWDGNQWTDLATGSAFAPSQEPPPVEIDDPTSPTGKRLVPRADALNQPGPNSQTPAQTANTLRDEFNNQTSQARTVANMYRNAIKGADAQSPAGDMGLIYSFMKALDPGSSVKEGEYAQGEELTGAYGKMWQSYNKAKDGTKLLPEVRKDILGQVRNIYQSHIPTYKAAQSRYTDIAKRQRLNPADVVTDLPTIDEGPSAPPGPAPIGKNGKPMIWKP